MKMPKFPKLFPLALKRRKKLQASTTARRSQPVPDDYDSDEPQTRLSSAFVIVLILHVVAVGGIYAFNSIKAHRQTKDPFVSKSPAASRATPVPLPRPERAGPASPVAALTPAHASPTTPAPGGRTHRVAAGENLTKIAAQYGVAVHELEQANGAKNVATLRAGQILTIPKSSGAPTKQSSTTYVVARGDNPVVIARKFGVTPAELLKANNIEDPKKLQIGQTLKVPAGKKGN